MALNGLLQRFSFGACSAYVLQRLFNLVEFPCDEVFGSWMWKEILMV